MKDGDSIIVEIKVVPQAGEFKCSFDKAGVLKCKLKSAAQQGAANGELIKTLAKLLRIPQSSIVIISGMLSRKKRLKIEGCSNYNHFLKAIGLEPVAKQMTMFEDDDD